jgi:hypothetical protein
MKHIPQKKHYWKCRRLGLCVKCGKDANGAIRCIDCVNKSRKGYTCKCGKSTENSRRVCEECRKKPVGLLDASYSLNEKQQIRRQRKIDGLCTWCAKAIENDLRNRKTGALRSMCRSCLRENADKLARYREDRRNKGLCERCGKFPPKEGVKNCVKCSEYITISSKQHSDRTFFDKRARAGSLRYSVATAKMLWSLWKEQRGRCALTGWRLNRDNSQVDHIIPISKGGMMGERSNLRWLHKDVNQAKRALSDEGFLNLCISVAEFVRKHDIQRSC